MTERLWAISWPFERAAEAGEALARAAGFASTANTRRAMPPTAAILADPARRDEWCERLGECLGVEVTAVDEVYPQVAALIHRAPPALVAVELDGTLRLVAVLHTRRGRLQVVDPAQRLQRLSAATLVRAFAAPAERRVRPHIEALLGSLALSPSRHAEAADALAAEQLAHTRLRGVWLMRPAPATSLASAARATQLKRWLVPVLALYALQYLVLAAAWHAVGQASLLGHVDAGWLDAFCIALASSVPVQGAIALASARFSIRAGAWLRERVLAGILALDPDVVRKQGSGALLVSVMEAGVLESAGIGGSVATLFATLDLIMAGFIFVYAAQGVVLAIVLGCSLVGGAIALRRALQQRHAWTRSRLAVTQELVECMVGHRTRIVQEPVAQRHVAEDELLQRYLADSRQLDRTAVWLAGLPRFTLLACLAWLALALITRTSSTFEFALAFGGALLATRALTSLGASLQQLTAAAVAWRYAGPLVRAHAAPEAPGDPTTVCTAREDRERGVLEARGLTVTNRDATEPILSRLDVRIEAGDRILLEGASGSGKSTLAYALAGLRPIARGLLSFNGLDRSILGSGWSQRVTVSPQFHDNHVFSASFAFNVLLGRRWPAEPGDLVLAETVCRELGLGELLDKMPAGMQQMLGEVGWQLSHGERSRVFAARAILADADLTVLDESIAALDPETAEVVLQSVRTRTRTLLLIAHP